VDSERQDYQRIVGVLCRPDPEGSRKSLDRNQLADQTSAYENNQLVFASPVASGLNLSGLAWRLQIYDKLDSLQCAVLSKQTVRRLLSRMSVDYVYDKARALHALTGTQLGSPRSMAVSTFPSGMRAGSSIGQTRRLGLRVGPIRKTLLIPLFMAMAAPDLA
jgi:hypothetical protein